MPLLDFSPERRSLNIGGRRFRIRRLTVGAVARALTVYGREIGGLRAMYEIPNVWTLFGLTPAIELLSKRPDALISVLRHVVETDAPESEWPLAELADAVAALSHWPTIARSLVFSDRSGNPDDLSAESRAIVGTAREMGVDPVAVLEWPMEAWVAAQDALAPKGEGETVGVGLGSGAFVAVPDPAGA